ncbi:hypothetical protein [Paenibacillus whitsoniae]|uniref:Uncharacterized protein n=1 Tax=Paenibacillus whitsoniae TaxID=2496558 RepID=A0A3S0ALB9_9BACL|nr:hypothetical protein [Paenibacillus whitsoniae]RTE05371.1 hypothetical protein EJQ19_25285 [Paenibacillus whitsoniae]
MGDRFKIRAYCSSRTCDYVHKEDVMTAINYESAYSLAIAYNAYPAKPGCPSCGEPITFYAHSVLEVPWPNA